MHCGFSGRPKFIFHQVYISGDRIWHEALRHSPRLLASSRELSQTSTDSRSPLTAVPRSRVSARLKIPLTHRTAAQTVSVGTAVMMHVPRWQHISNHGQAAAGDLQRKRAPLWQGLLLNRSSRSLWPTLNRHQTSSRGFPADQPTDRRAPRHLLPFSEQRSLELRKRHLSLLRSSKSHNGFHPSIFPAQLRFL